MSALESCRAFTLHGIEPCPAGEDCRWVYARDADSRRYYSDYDTPASHRRLFHSRRIMDGYEWVGPLDTPTRPKGWVQGILWELHGSPAAEQQHQEQLRRLHAAQGWAMDDGCYCPGCYCPLSTETVCWLDSDADPLPY